MKKIEKHHRMPDGAFVCIGIEDADNPGHWITLGKHLRKQQQKHSRLLAKYGKSEARKGR